jgi:protein-tyrosine phosphatase
MNARPFKRVLDFPGLLNARDLGGYPTVDGSRTRWHSLLRADDVAQLTRDGVRALKDFGVETVIDLRWSEEVAANPGPIAHRLRHIRHLQLPLLFGTENEWRTRSADCPKEEWKCMVLDRARDGIREVMRAIARAPPGPLLFHCVAGKDRTGVIAALLLALADVVPDAIASDYAASSRHLRDGYLRRYAHLDAAHVLESVRCPEEGVYRMLEHLAAFGGLREYLGAIGLTADEIARLRARLRE